MKKTHVAFLWHMHQPYYKDPVDGRYFLPWVRMHSIKGYYDMIAILEEYPAVRQTFNLVPSLVSQILDYCAGGVRDTFMEYTLKNASDLSEEDRAFILSNFFMANWDTMIKPHPRYYELLIKRGTRRDAQSISAGANSFSPQEMRDLQVWFNLSWFGYMSRKRFPLVREMISKGGGFTEKDKAGVIELQLEIMKQVIKTYQKLAQSGQIEITCTPFYHPILPLLCDTKYALRAMPSAVLPERFNHPEDADAQIAKAVRFTEEIFGVRPCGMWPSEGSVCPELIPLFEKNGINWIATDEGILARSINVPDKGKALYKPYKAVFEDSSVSIVFRDRGLSDAIGFVYARNEPVEAAGNLLGNIRAIGEYVHSSGQEPLVSIILDGENAWEHYPDGGEGFLRNLYQNLSSDKQFNTVRIGDYVRAIPPSETIASLHTGSWINQNFDIWIGDVEENTAWNYLLKARDFLVKQSMERKDIPEEALKAAWEELYMAQGSDWFWWYGDDFSSDNDEIFDLLFRTHTANIYKHLGVTPPAYLSIPIIIEKVHHKAHPPIGFMTPVLDGQVTHYYEWYMAGHFSALQPGGTMHRSEGLVSGIHFGFDQQTLYLRVDFMNMDPKEAKLSMAVHILNPVEAVLKIDLAKGKPPKQMRVFTSEDHINFKDNGLSGSVAVDKVLEAGIDFSKIGASPAQTCDFFLSVSKDGITLERHPKSGFISFVVPGCDFEYNMWTV